MSDLCEHTQMQDGCRPCWDYPPGTLIRDSQRLYELVREIWSAIRHKVDPYLIATCEHLITLAERFKRKERP